jgi:hypothetical protein
MTQKVANNQPNLKKTGYERTGFDGIIVRMAGVYVPPPTEVSSVEWFRYILKIDI